MKKRMAALDRADPPRPWPELRDVRPPTEGMEPRSAGWRRAGIVLLALTVSAATIAFAMGAFSTEGSSLAPGATVEPQSQSPCAPITKKTRFTDTALGHWLAEVLVDVGAPGGYALSQDLLVEEHFAYTLNVPEYQGHFEVNVSAEEPDPLNVDLSFLPVIVKSETTHCGARIRERKGFSSSLLSVAACG
jgi:hypothetical protein